MTTFSLNSSSRCALPDVDVLGEGGEGRGEGAGLAEEAVLLYPRPVVQLERGGGGE